MICTRQCVRCDHYACSGLQALDEGRRRSYLCFGGLEKAIFEKNIEDKSRLFASDEGSVPSPQMSCVALSENSLRIQNPARKEVSHWILLKLQS